VLSPSLALLSAFFYGLAGYAVSPLININPRMGWTTIMVMFATVVLGGLGSVEGTIIAGFIYGTVEAFAGHYIGAQRALILYWHMAYSLI